MRAPIFTFLNLLLIATVTGLVHSAYAAPAAPGKTESWEDAYSVLLKKYASPGGVRYAAWKNNVEDATTLKTIVDAIAAADLSTRPSPASPAHT